MQLVILCQKHQGFCFGSFHYDTMYNVVQCWLLCWIWIGDHVAQLQMSDIALGRFFLSPFLAVQGSQFLRGNTFRVFLRHRSFVCPNGIGNLVQCHKTESHCTPHASIIRTQHGCLAVIEQSVQMHIEEFIGLSQSIPSTIILGADSDRSSIGFHGGLGLLQFHILVSHQGPSTSIRSIQFQCPLKVKDCLLPLLSKRIVVSNDTTSLWSILVNDSGLMGQLRQSDTVFLDVQNIRVDVFLFQ
mmetsp:Transcript_26156/g.63774  ORF Transcript_26156/g.63774 Transcript_26156/m.63774 type:complete len:243 (-) Transcript_26156:1116-1844(-)